MLLERPSHGLLHLAVLSWRIFCWFRCWCSLKGLLLRLYLVIGNGDDFQLTQYSSSHSRISKTFVQFRIIVIPKIRISNDSVMRNFFLLVYPSNMCAVRATWPLVDESLLLGIAYYPISITHTLDSAYILTRYELINTFSLRSMETFQ